MYHGFHNILIITTVLNTENNKKSDFWGIVPGYVCNPGSQRERDAASKR